MATPPVVAATDGSEESTRAVEWAAREADLRGAPLRIVSAIGLLPRMIGRPGGPGLDTVADAIAKDRDRALAAAATRATQLALDLLIDTGRLDGPPARAVTQSGSGAQLLVVGSRGAGAFTAMMLGSVSRYVATHACCPVVVVRDETAVPHRQVGVGLGDLDHCADALRFAFEEASLRAASPVAIPAWHGPPGRARVRLSARADLVVIGRHARHPGLTGPGAVTHAVLNHAHGTVVTVPSA